MSIKKLALIIIVIVDVVCLIALILFAYFFVLGNSLDFENRNALLNLNRVKDALTENTDQLYSIARDWAWWDDSYKFIRDKNKEFVEVNPTDTTLDGLGINYLAFINNKNQFVYQKTYDLNLKKEIDSYFDFPAEIKNNTKGIIQLQNRQLLLVVVIPILKSDLSGPSPGKIVFGRLINEIFLKHLSQVTHQAIRILPFLDSDLQGKTQFVKPLNSDFVNGFSVIKDTDGDNIGVVEITLSRDIYKNSLRSLKYIILSLSVLAVILGIISYAFLNYYVLSKIFIIINDVESITDNGNFDTRVKSVGGIELNRLAKSINQMLFKIKELQNKSERNNIFLGEKVKEIELKNSELEKNKKAILNLLEDEKELEVALKGEKGTVEQRVEERTSQLNSEKIKLVASISSLSSGFIMMDQSNSVLFINRKAEKILGLSKDKIKSLVDILNLFPLNSKIFKIYDEYKREKILVEKKGEVTLGTKVLIISFLPILKKVDDKIEVLGNIVLINDITEEKVIERSKDEFFSIASHELRTPLTAIRGNTDMILEYFAKDIKNNDFKEMLNDIHESSVRLISIVNDFLDMSRLELDKTKFIIEKVDPINVVFEVVKEYQITGSKSGVHLEMKKSDENMPEVLADVNKFKQILINLVGNAIKFSQKGSVVISLKKNDHAVKISVTDSGIGIPLENQKFLFRKFQQAENNILTRDGTKGTGLGLYISKLLVEKMNGEIKLESSKIGKGSTFSFTLPTDFTTKS